MLGTRFARALDLAQDWHGTQTRKGVSTPYMAHLMAVSSLVMEYGGNEDQAIAGLLHDALEDAPTAAEAKARDTLILAEFGADVARMVEGCTDGRPDAEGDKFPWKVRKVAYLESLEAKPAGTLLVTGCDKLHNLAATVRDLRRDGPATLDRFNAGPQGLTWYYSEIGRIRAARGVAVADDYARLLAEFRGLL